MAKNTFTTVKGRAEARKFPAKKPGTSGDKPKDRKALMDKKKKR